MSNLTILKTAIRQSDNLYSLNDLHQASGGLDRHSPFRFMRNESTQELISEMKNEMNTKSGVQKEAQGSDLIFKTLRGRNIQGTWVCEELVLSYAMWISPKFHLIVLRAFLAMHRNQPQQLALPEPEKKYTFEFTEYELEQLVWLWCGHKQMHTLIGDMIKPLETICS